jgi:hypothetical protein
MRIPGLVESSLADYLVPLCDVTSVLESLGLTTSMHERGHCWELDVCAVDRSISKANTISNVSTCSMASRQTLEIDYSYTTSLSLELFIVYEPSTAIQSLIDCPKDRAREDQDMQHQQYLSFNSYLLHRPKTSSPIQAI